MTGGGSGSRVLMKSINLIIQSTDIRNVNIAHHININDKTSDGDFNSSSKCGEAQEKVRERQAKLRFINFT